MVLAEGVVGLVSRSGLKAGARIETYTKASDSLKELVAPVSKPERGLKHLCPVENRPERESLRSQSRSAD